MIETTLIEGDLHTLCDTTWYARLEATGDRFTRP